MLTFLFWNLNNKPLHVLVSELVDLHEVDVLILAECDVASPIMLSELNSKSEQQFFKTFSTSQKIVIYTRFPDWWVRPISEGDGLSIRHLVHPILGQQLLIVGAHLSSKLHLNEEEQTLLATRLRPHIEKAEEQVGHCQTLIVGDLNMNPFEAGVASSEGLHGVMDRRIAQRWSREVRGKIRHFFYNPMWSRFGDESQGPVGTYYYNTSSPLNQFWHIFDQVLFRPCLLPYFRNEDLQVITVANSASLMKADGRPDSNAASDHFPLLFKLSF
jgi:hypothetical protein